MMIPDGPLGPMSVHLFSTDELSRYPRPDFWEVHLDPPEPEVLTIALRPPEELTQVYADYFRQRMDSIYAKTQGGRVASAHMMGIFGGTHPMAAAVGGWPKEGRVRKLKRVLGRWGGFGCYGIWPPGAGKPDPADAVALGVCEVWLDGPPLVVSRVVPMS